MKKIPYILSIFLIVVTISFTPIFTAKANNDVVLDSIANLFDNISEKIDYFFSSYTKEIIIDSVEYIEEKTANLIWNDADENEDENELAQINEIQRKNIDPTKNYLNYNPNNETENTIEIAPNLLPTSNRQNQKIEKSYKVLKFTTSSEKAESNKEIKDMTENNDSTYRKTTADNQDREEESTEETFDERKTIVEEETNDTEKTESSNNSKEKKQTGIIDLSIPFDEPFSKILSFKINGQSGPKKDDGDIPFSGELISNDILSNLSEYIPLSSNKAFSINGILNNKNRSKNKITLRGNINISLDNFKPGGLADLSGVGLSEATIALSSKGVKVKGKLAKDLNADAFAGVEIAAGTYVKAFFSGKDDNWYLEFAAGGDGRIEVFNIPIVKRGMGGKIRVHPAGIKIDGYLPIGIFTGSFQGSIDQFGGDLKGAAYIKVPTSAASEIVNKITDGAICGWENTTNGAKCGYEYVKNATICGTETVTNTAQCGTKTITNAAKCGTEYITSGADCGWTFLSSLFGGKKPKKCKKAKSCKVAETCEVAKSCEESKKPKACKFEKTCESKSNIGRYIGDVQGDLTLHLKGSLDELKAETKFTGHITGEYCFEGSCYGINQNIASFDIGPPTEICFPGVYFENMPDLSLSDDTTICTEI